MTELVKKKCTTCGEEKVKVLFFINGTNRCKDCRKTSQQKSRKSWSTVNEYNGGHYFGGNWKAKKADKID